MDQIICLVILLVWVVASVVAHKWLNYGQSLTCVSFVGCICMGLVFTVATTIILGLAIFLIVGALGL